MKGMHIWKTTMNVMGVTLKPQCVSFQRYIARVGRRAPSKKSAEFWQPKLRNAESGAEFTGLDVDSLIMEQVRQTKPPRRRAGLTELRVGSTQALPATRRGSTLKKEETVPKPEEEVIREKKDTLEETQKIKT